MTSAGLETESDPTTGESLIYYQIALDRGVHRVYLPLILKSYCPTPATCDPITLVDNSLYYEGSNDECWHKEDFPSPQAWFEETIPPDPSTTLRASSGSTATPLYFGIADRHRGPAGGRWTHPVGYHVRHRRRLHRLGGIV